MDQIAKPGERVEKSGVLCRVHAASHTETIAAVARLKTAFDILAARPTVAKLVREVS